MNCKTKFFSVPVILSACLVIVLLWAYWEVLNKLFSQLLRDDDYSFGLLLPLVSGYIVYLKWPEIHRRPWRPSWTGLVVLTLSMGFYIIAVASTDVYTPCASFIVSLGGVILLLGGWRLVRLLSFPLLLLFFMIPLPQFLIQQISLPLQLLSSQLATEILQIIGVPAIRHGNIIDLGVRQLEIVSACSGLRYILALTALGIVFCYFNQRSLWKAAVLLISLIPAAIAVNALRVAAMAVYPVIQEGFWHGFSGWLIFILCFGFLSLFNLALNYLLPGAQRATDRDASPDQVPLDHLKSSYLPYLTSAIIIVLATGYLAQTAGNIPSIPLRQSFDNFPMHLGPWEGKRSYIESAMFKATGASDYLNADFQNPALGLINLWIAYYENQKGGGSVHSPFSCYMGSGWALVESGMVDLAHERSVRFMVMDYDGIRYLVYYWYLQRGRWLTSEYLNKIYLSYDGLLRRRADGTLVRLTTPAEPNVISAKERLNAFTELLIPVLPQFITY